MKNVPCWWWKVGKKNQQKEQNNQIKNTLGTLGEKENYEHLGILEDTIKQVEMWGGG